MKFSNLVDLLHYRSQNQPDQKTYTFLQDGETISSSLTYQELELQARAIAAYLQSINATGERVLLLYPPGLEFIAGFFGCLYAGAIAIPAYPPRPNQSLSRLEAIATDAEVKVAFTTSSLLVYLESRFDENPELARRMHLLATDNIASDLGADWQKPTLSSDTLAFLQYTSGSTGTPKGVMIAHSNLMHNLAMSHKSGELTSNSRTVTWLPFGHNTGLIVGVIQPVYSDFPVTIMSPLDFLQKPLRWLMAISRYKATQSLAPNFAYDMACFQTTAEQRAMLDLSSWELAVSGAEPVRAETIERFVATFTQCGFRREAFNPGYGMAESVVGISLGLKKQPAVIQNIEKAAFEQNRVVVAVGESESTQKIVGCGRTWLDQKILIVNPESLIQCPPEEVGEIWVSSPSVAQGYWNRPDATKETFHGYLADTNEGPFLRTGDLGFLLDKELFVTGRLKDLIIIRGRNHYPQDIEFTVEKSHPALQPSCSAAFSVEVESEERLVIACEVKQTYLEKLNVDQVVAAIRQAVSQQHDLQVYAVLLLNTGSIPKTGSNKIQRHACRVGFLDGSLDVVASSIHKEFNVIERQVFPERKALLDTSPEKRQGLLKSHLQNLISKILTVDPSQLDWQQPLTSMGLDSLMVIELTNLLEQSLGCSLGSTVIFDYPTVEALVDYLVKKVLSSEPSESSQAELPQDDKPEALSYSALVAIQSGGSKPPFFCVPGSVGTTFYLHTLALHLGQDQPFYGLQALGLDDEAQPYTKIEEIAAHYIEALQSIQPQGPYFLGGHSFGGKVAFEISQQLLSSGHQVALLAVLDIPAPLPNQPIRVDWDDIQCMVELASLFGRLLGKKLEVSYNDLALLAPDEQVNYVVEQLKIVNVLPSEAGTKQVRGLVKVLKANLQAMANYMPQEVYPTRIAFFRANEVHPWDAATWLSDEVLRDSTFGWSQLSIEAVDIHFVPGDHVTMMVEPHVQILAERLRVSLERAQAHVLANEVPAS
ncbi:AMP-dependent synthetase [Brasilonema octagenarum UFV-E1]|uniref:AMP-dependent synthetase n=1 Tax=Brasilonema sennae CENA114 TaxID=415709 RepID=A0A856MHA3_9CYAN|nr:AMP-binding protein [Brasilonema sennae]QDL09624.1 AMP-dependent synthetase [Brasilonema sennae CENA114]QDL15980.1 AMP-dependent synthetase [Brasilonema octagenarum UFV-E1]